MPTPNYSLNRLRRLYIAPQTDPMTLPTVTGTSNYCLFTKLNIEGVQGVINRPDITGSRGTLPGIAGKHTGTWSVGMSLAGAGAAGVDPDCDPLLQATFGAVPTIVASTSVTYALSDNIITAALFHYRHTQVGGTTLTNQISMGSVVDTATFTMGADIATVDFSGKSIFVLDSDNFASYTGALAIGKGGLGSFPAEPSTPTYHGLPVIGFTGSLTMDTQTVVELKSATVKISTGNQIVDDSFGYWMGSGVQGDMRQIDVSLTLDDSDSAAIIDLKQKAFSFAPITVTLVCGTVAGNTWTFNLSNIQMVNPKFSEGSKGRMRVDFGASIAHGSTLAGLDALSLVIT